MDCSQPGSPVHRILQAGILERAAISSSRGSSPPRDQASVSSASCIDRQILFTTEPQGKPVAQMVKNLPAMWETCVRSLDWEDPLEEGMAAHSSIPAWRIPWTEEPGRPHSIGLQRTGHN